MRLLISALVALLVFLVDYVDAQTRKHVVFFSAKDTASFLSSDHLEYLSEKALQRRMEQNIHVTLQDYPVSASYLGAISTAGCRVISTSRWFNSAVVESPDEETSIKLQSLPFVKAIISAPNKANSSRRGSQEVTGTSILKHDDNSCTSFSLNGLQYGKAANQNTMIAADFLHDRGFLGEGMVIAVLDAGFLNVDKLAAFDSLRQQGRILATWDFVRGEESVYEDNSHGTMVLSTIAANVPGEIIGTAPRASFFLLRTEEAASESIIEEYNWASAAEYADSAGADIINSSLGYTEFDDPAQNHTYEDLDGNSTPVTIAADIAASKGMIVLNSAGNLGNSSWNFISAPADADSILAVGAVNAQKEYASFSSNGPSADGRVKPDVSAQGAQAAVVNPSGAIITANGTSFSSPVLAGGVACLWQAVKHKNNMQVIEAVKASADKFYTPDTLTGYGVPDLGKAYLSLDPTAVTDFASDIFFTAGPNPFTGLLNIAFFSASSQDLKVTAWDAAGRVIFEKKYPFDEYQKCRLQLNESSQWAAGKYTLSVASNDVNRTLTVIKVK